MSDHTKTPTRLINAAQAKIQMAKEKMDRARKLIPDEYQEFLMGMEKLVPLCMEKVPIDNEAASLGIVQEEHGTYVRVEIPYLSIEGRILIAREEHKKLGKKLDITSVMSRNAIVATVVSEVYGSATGTAACSNENGISDAETLAIERALGFLGYGPIRAGIINKTELHDASNAQGMSPQSNDLLSKHAAENVTPIRTEDKIFQETENANSPLYLIVACKEATSPETLTSYLLVAIEDEEGRQTEVIAVGPIYAQIKEMNISSKKWFQMSFERTKQDNWLISSLKEVKQSA